MTLTEQKYKVVKELMAKGIAQQLKEFEEIGIKDPSLVEEILGRNGIWEEADPETRRRALRMRTGILINQNPSK